MVSPTIHQTAEYYTASWKMLDKYTVTVDTQAQASTWPKYCLPRCTQRDTSASRAAHTDEPKKNPESPRSQTLCPVRAPRGQAVIRANNYTHLSQEQIQNSVRDGCEHRGLLTCVYSI